VFDVPGSPVRFEFWISATPLLLDIKANPSTPVPRMREIWVRIMGVGLGAGFG
jgi:hypothetical protein